MQAMHDGYAMPSSPHQCRLLVPNVYLGDVTSLGVYTIEALFRVFR